MNCLMVSYLSMKRIVVTGIGALSPLGNSFSASWEALKSGTSGIAQITKFDASGLQWKIGGELKAFNPYEYLTQKEINRLDPFVQYATAAAVMAAENAGLIAKSELSKIQKSRSKITFDSSLCSSGVIIGSSRGGISTMEREIVNNFKAHIPHSPFRTKGVSPFLMPATTISMAASFVAQKLGIKGPCLGISNACASGTNAIGEAFRLIKHGHSDLVFAGGSEAPICRICVEGYGISGALSRTRSSDKINAPLPFDRNRDGFILSEGACILVLEEREKALKRGANIYGEIIGYGNTTDAFHMTRPDPAGEARAMLMSMHEAGIGLDRVDYINTHGTATRIGDIAEADAINMVFGKKAHRIPATAVKSMTGHMLATSGALEVAFTLMTMKEGIIPPTINLHEKDPVCGLNIVTEKRSAEIEFAISNSFGFGGVNAVIALRNSSTLKAKARKGGKQRTRV